MRKWMFAALLLLATGQACAVDVCPVLRNQQSSPDPATRVAAIACNEHLIWYRPFIDRDGRLASSAVTESENTVLDDGASQAWRRVARYWQETGLLRRSQHSPGASECARASYDRGPLPGCRAFVVDNPWSATFVSWVLAKAGLPGFRNSASHVDYVRDAYLRGGDNAYQYLDPARARAAVGDLMCYVRGNERAYGYAGLVSVVQVPTGGLNMHCEIVVATNPGGDSMAYLIGGNVQQGVTMRLLPLNRNGEFWSLPQSAGGEDACAPDNEAACNFNRQDWAVLLKLKKSDLLAQLPRMAEFTPATVLTAPPPSCCVNCVVGSGVPRCPAQVTP